MNSHQTAFFNGLEAHRRFFEPPGDIQSAVREDAVGAGALKAHHGFKREFLFINVARGSGCFQKGVFAADVVGKSRCLEFIFDATQNIQLGKTRLNHHHVGAFFQI